MLLVKYEKEIAWGRSCRCQTAVSDRRTLSWRRPLTHGRTVSRHRPRGHRSTNKQMIKFYRLEFKIELCCPKMEVCCPKMEVCCPKMAHRCIGLLNNYSSIFELVKFEQSFSGKLTLFRILFYQVFKVKKHFFIFSFLNVLPTLVKPRKFMLT